jgi:hypothetical protein
VVVVSTTSEVVVVEDVVDCSGMVGSASGNDVVVGAREVVDSATVVVDTSLVVVDSSVVVVDSLARRCGHIRAGGERLIRNNLPVTVIYFPCEH